MDKYDLEAEELLAIKNETDFRAAVYEHWNAYDPLFQTCSPQGCSFSEEMNQECGCLTQVKTGYYSAWTQELTDRIREDERIPNSPHGITRETLRSGVLAEYQREMDNTIRKED